MKHEKATNEHENLHEKATNKHENLHEKATNGHSEEIYYPNFRS